MAADEIAGMRAQVATACRILARQGLVSGILGHVSVRIDAERFLVRCRGPREKGLLFTTPRDVRILRFDGAPEPGEGVPDEYSPPKELPLHVETLRARPEACAVVHAHPPAIVTADLAGVELRPIVGAFNIPAARLAADGVPVYPRSVLIRRSDLAAEMLAAMGPHPVCVLRGHGLTTIGENVPQAVVRAINVDELARLSLEVARSGGRAAPIPPEDLAELPDLGSAFNDALLWEHHVALLRHEGLDTA
ncbi:class II aldolase/adducin family protein [Actinomadura sp. 7K507]|uniref:class II aldolase/adducin family protein n=1 Tax=Actinomadura sp. 7K507 TaxID=2530365 RepID=UPI0010490A6E|nr:class II aldolase/adducin family protein [Actinomadura sp. 7K507]TDC98439.1 class II aldolase/adducin family protein [Actinomadura sp. 7K507]